MAEMCARITLDEGLDEAFVESLAVQLIARAHECERRLAEAK